ncbi:MAG: Uma2 family endonuclease, partial [Isosphaeraceae bacterium]
ITFGMYLRIRRSNPGYRMAYLDGKVEIKSPEFRYERGAWKLGLLVPVVAMAHGIPFSGAGSTTFRLGDQSLLKGSGKEPDESFYFANEPLIRGKDRIILPGDPPPDLWIEVDNRGSSWGRLPLYARLGVPEVWQLRVRKNTLWFGRLEGETCQETDRSLSLSMLTPERVLDALNKAKGVSDSTWLRWLTGWAATLGEPPATDAL